MKMVEDAPRNASKRVWVEGERLDGREVKKGVLLPLGEPGNARERLQRIGVRVVPFGDEITIAKVDFGSKGAKIGLAQGQKIVAVEVPADRPRKEWMFVPALLLLGLVVWSQRRRMQHAGGSAVPA
jgi:hypothetical protein